MSSTYSTNLALELIGTGDQAGTWGNTTNTNLGTLIEQAISGYVTQAVSTGTDTTITIPNGATGVARNMYIELTGTGGASTNLIVPANKKLYFIYNNTSSGQVTVKVSGQTGVSVPNKAKMILVSDGTDIVDATNYIGNISAASANITVLTSASATITNLIATSASITTLTNNPTFSGGTANGVLYLNGSKVATSGSALTFDGTNGLGFGTGGTGNTAAVLTLKGSSATNYGAAITGTRNGSGSWFIGDAGTALGSGTLGFIYYNYTTNDPWIWYDGGASAERMRLTSTGLGIGTSSPAAKLSVDSGSSALNANFNSTNASGIYVRFQNSGTSIGDIGGGGSVVSGGTAGDFAIASRSGNLVLGTGSVTRATLDSSGNLGIGTSSPNIGGVNKAITVNSATNTNCSYELSVNNVLQGSLFTGISTSSVALYTVANGPLLFGTNNAEKARITATGEFCIGNSATDARLLVSKTSDGSEAAPQVRIEGNGYSAFHWLDATAYYIGQNSGSRSLRVYSSAETAGVELTAGGTSWGTFSDERLKYDIEPVTNAIESLANIRTVKYRLKDVDSPESKKKIGVIAQDLVGVIDEVVDSSKRPDDETDYLNVRYSELIPVLVKAIQEQQAMIKSLEAKVAALESK